jgi:AAA+ ATPase superfamily predicted ATPase
VQVKESLLSSLLENLVKSGYVEKKEGKYSIPDPVLTRAFREL